MSEATIVDTSTNLGQAVEQAAPVDASNYEAWKESQAKGPDVESKPAEKPAPEPVAAQEAKAEDESEAAEPAKETEYKPSGYKRLKAENERLKAELAARETPKAEQSPAQTAPVGDRPKIADFDSVEEWKDADDEWKEGKKAQQKRLEAHTERLAKARQAHGEAFEEALEVVAGIRSYESTVEAITESTYSAEIVYHLGKNPEEAAKFSAMTPAQQIREVGRIEAKLELAAATPVPETKAKPTRVPPVPIKPLSGGKSAANAGEPDATDYESWKAREYERLKKTSAYW